MAYEQPLFVLAGLKAGADLSGKQFRFVKLDSSGDAVVCSGATDIPIGVLQNKPTSGQAVEVMAIGISKIEGDADLAIGDMIGTSSDGQAAAYVAGTDTTKPRRGSRPHRELGRGWPDLGARQLHESAPRRVSRFL